MMKLLPKGVRACAILLVVAFIPLKAGEVEVFAAISLSDALKEIAAGYEKETGDKVIFNLAASGVLDTQIKAGAPADIFFSADEAKMDDLAKQKLVVAESRKDILANSLAIVVPADSTATITAATDLADPQFARIALGQAKTVPAGTYAQEYLAKIGIWDKVSARVIPMENVRATLAAVETGNADAGIVYKTDAFISKKVKIAWEVPAADGPAITYPVALVQGSKNAAAAKKFLDYLETPDSLKTFEKYGFIAKG